MHTATLDLRHKIDENPQRDGIQNRRHDLAPSQFHRPPHSVLRHASPEKTSTGRKNSGGLSQGPRGGGRIDRGSRMAPTGPVDSCLRRVICIAPCLVGQSI